MAAGSGRGLPGTGILSCLLISLIPAATGVIECSCTTRSCEEDRRLSCEAEHSCYVQVMPGTTHPLVRGCIDERTPLLCENRRPLTYKGSWPLLYCCNEGWCNKDIVPTLPPEWMDAKPKDVDDLPQNNGLKIDITLKQNTESYKQLDWSEDYVYNPSLKGNSRGMGAGLNPLYIAVPVAGACVLLAIIIFAIYVLRRQSHYLEEYRYHGNLKDKHPHPSCDVVSGVDCCKEELQTAKQCMYAPCERASSGSETKLLMKV